MTGLKLLLTVMVKLPLALKILVVTGSHWFNGDATFALASKKYVRPDWPLVASSSRFDPNGS